MELRGAKGLRWVAFLPVLSPGAAPPLRAIVSPTLDEESSNERRNNSSDPPGGSVRTGSGRYARFVY